MKKYKMRIKDDNAEYNTYGLHVCHDISRNFLWLCDGTHYKYTGVGVESLAKEFTIEEIEKMPYGFVNQYDLIEVEEQLYYIKLPHVDDKYSYMNYDNVTKEMEVNDKESYQRLKVKFTKQEIEEKFPEYANEHFMVKVEEDK